MIEALDLVWQFALRLWQLWSVAFIALPLSLAVIAAWDFHDWRNRR
jgi:hypothetical protein